MTGANIAGGAFLATFVFVALAFGCRSRDQDIELGGVRSNSIAGIHQGLLYGRITADDGTTYEGRLRWGGDEEALWGNDFNGFKDANPWVAYLAPEQLPKRHDSIRVLGIRIARWERELDLRRPFMARFGDIARIEPSGRDIHVTLKSGTTFRLDRFSADDLADGLRVWDYTRGVVDLAERQIRSIEFLPAPAVGDGPHPLHGTVHTRHGEFTGFVQWDREDCVGSDELDGFIAEGELSLRFDTIRSIARRSRDSSLVTLLDGSELLLSGTREVGEGNRGMYVDDGRYGRVLISWDAFERVDFSPGGNGPTYDDFPPGRPLTGSVLTRSGLRLAGRLVFDLDESETTETLDAPSQGVDYTITFGLIASIEPRGIGEPEPQLATVILHSGEELHLEPTGDLGQGNAGILVFVDNGQRREYVPWTDVEQVEFDPTR